MSIAAADPVHAAVAGWQWVEDGLGLVGAGDLAIRHKNHALQGWAAHATTLPELLGVSEEALRERLHGDKPLVFETEATPAGKRRFPVEYTVTAAVLDGPPMYVVHGRSVEAVMEKDLMLKSFTRVIDISNRKLRHQKVRIQELLDNMRSGIFSVNDKGTVTDPVSGWCTALFGTAIERRNVFDTVLATLDAQARSLADSVFVSVFGEDDLQWDLMEENLPSRIAYAHPDGQTRTMRITYHPIWNDDELLKRIMFVVDDLTEVEALGLRVMETEHRNQRNLDYAAEISQLDVELFETFVTESKQLLGSCRDALEHWVSPQGSSSGIHRLLRQLHTVKGNARIFKITSVQNLAHSVEERLQRLRDEGMEATPNQIEEIREDLAVISRAIDEFETIGRRMLSPDDRPATSPVATAAVPEARIVSLRQAYKALARQGVGGSEMDALGGAVQALTHVPIRGLLVRLSRMCKDLARELGKSIHDVELRGDDLQVDAKVCQLMRDVLLHTLRNSLDHGIEAPEQREASGKPAAGHIQVHCAKQDGHLHVWIRDDGQGIDVGAVRRKALQQGRLTLEQVDAASDQDIMNLLFLPGFSLARSITTVSGRGIGMDVVRTTMEQMHGQAEIASVHGEGTVVHLRMPTAPHERL